MSRVHVTTHAEASHAVTNAARFLLALKDGPRDDYYRANKAFAWQSLRSALSVLDEAESPTDRADTSAASGSHSAKEASS